MKRSNVRNKLRNRGEIGIGRPKGIRNKVASTVAGMVLQTNRHGHLSRGHCWGHAATSSDPRGSELMRDSRSVSVGSSRLGTDSGWRPSPRHRMAASPSAVHRSRTSRRSGRLRPLLERNKQERDGNCGLLYVEVSLATRPRVGVCALQAPWGPSQPSIHGPVVGVGESRGLKRGGVHY